MVSGAIDPVRGEVPAEVPALQPAYYTARPYAAAPYPPSPFRARAQIGRPVSGIPYQPSYVVCRHPYPVPVQDVFRMLKFRGSLTKFTNLLLILRRYHRPHEVRVPRISCGRNHRRRRRRRCRQSLHHHGRYEVIPAD
ncbi:MAG: hypothetical protein GY696_36345, partial [Gammaproteobacteria bacterium]|nr:hypothetical protein [Gammaproteobacteria bacterium]